MSNIKSNESYRMAQICHLSGHDVLANLFLRAAYGVQV